MIDKVGQGTYSNVYKARDRVTRELVALKKVLFDKLSESIKFMAREIMILQRLDHPNVIKLKGLTTSRMQYSIYLVFDFMQSDMARVICRPQERLTEPQVKCYMHQLLSGLQHCHDRGILRRDIKGSNLLIDKNGILKIADFGLANFYNPNHNQYLTNGVVTLWYRAPELFLGATNYGIGIDLWSAGFLLEEMFTRIPIMPGRTEFFFTSPLACELSGLPVIYWEDDGLNHTNEQIKHVNSKLSRSHTLHENQRKNLASGWQTEIFVSSEEELRKKVEAYVPNEEQGRRTSSVSDTSESKDVGLDDQKLSDKIHSHVNVTNLPPLPKPKQHASNKEDNNNRSGQILRSASSRDFRNPKQGVFEIDG